jgi:GntR family transcriptional regulator
MLGSSSEKPSTSSVARRDAERREPKYWSLKRHLLEMLRSRAPGTAIPTERALATGFEVSRTTVRQALSELTAEGRLVRIQGKGTFAAGPKVALPLRGDGHRDSASHTDYRVLEISELVAESELADRLDITPGARVQRVRGLRLAGAEPMAVENIYLPLGRFRGLRAHLAALIEPGRVLRDRFGVRPGRGEETIETALADPTEAEVLGVDVGTPMLLLSRKGIDRDGRAYEWVRAVYRGDRYKFVATV